MSDTEMKRSIKELEPYAKILNHLMEATLNSHLLLDEDLDSLYKIWNRLTETSDTKINFAYVLCASVGAGSVAMFNNHQKLMSLAISATPLITGVAYHCFKIYRVTLYIKQFDDAIAALKNQFSLNNKILAHLQRQEYSFNTLSESSKELYVHSLNSKYTLIFVKVVTKNLLNVCMFMQKELKYYSEKLPQNETYIYLVDWNLKTFEARFEVTNDLSFIDSSNYLKRMFDAYILITSNYLGCICLYLCNSIWLKNTNNIDYVLNNSIPLLYKCLITNINNTELNFNEQLKVLTPEPPKITNKPKEHVNIFEAPMLEMMNKLQLTYGLTTALYEKIHNDNSTKVDEVSLILVDLNDKMSEANLVLRTLQKLANIIAQKSLLQVAKVETPTKEGTSHDVPVKISYDDIIECNEETFSGYTGLPNELDSNDLKILSLNKTNEDNNSEEMSITQSQLIHELAQKLTEVRKKKGLDLPKAPKTPVPLPRRNKSYEEVLKSPRRSTKVLDAISEHVTLIKKPIFLKNLPIPTPPPPPPPSPSYDFQHIANFSLTERIDPKKSLYENVAAQRLKVKEEIYEDESS